MILLFNFEVDACVICGYNYRFLQDFKVLRDGLKMFVFICRKF